MTEITRRAANRLRHPAPQRVGNRSEAAACSAGRTQRAVTRASTGTSTGSGVKVYQLHRNPSSYGAWESGAVSGTATGWDRKQKT